MSYEWIPSPNFKLGRTQDIKYIVIHHWDDPAKKPTVAGVVGHFENREKEVSAHYIVSDQRVIQMVRETDVAWHARQANPFTIGIEVDPNVPGGTYATVGNLVREIRERWGNLPLRRHCDFNNTSCPGNLDLARIDLEANKEEDMTIKTAKEVNLLWQLNGIDRPPTEKEIGEALGRELDEYVTYLLQTEPFKANLAKVKFYSADIRSLAARVEELKATTDPKVLEFVKAFKALVKE